MRNELLDGFRLREKRIEPLTGNVRGRDGNSHLPPKCMEVLLCLAKNPRKLVLREKLLEKVWGDAHASQESLSHTISEIRHALGDNPEHPEYIQTIPKRGYRLLVEPELSAEDDKQEIPIDKPARSTLIGNLIDRGVIQASAVFLIVGWVLIQVADLVVPILGLPGWTTPLVTFVVIGGFPVVIVFAWFFEYAEGRFYLDRGKVSPTITTGLERNYLTMVAAFAITTVGALIYQYSVGFSIPEDGNVRPEIVSQELIPIEPNSIAVLKFMNFDGSETTRIFSDGLGEDVLDRLARIPGLRVASRNDSWELAADASSDTVRERLRVAYFIEGSVRIVGEEIRVVVQLIDSQSGFHRLSRDFNHTMDDFLSVQEEITGHIVANLRPALPPETQMAMSIDFEPASVDAYVLYRRGKQILDEPKTMESLDDAVSLFSQALEIDPEYPSAFAGLCSARSFYYELSHDENDVLGAEQACFEALSTNAKLESVHTSLGQMYLTKGQLMDAKRAFSDALKLNTRNARATLGLASVARRENNPFEAEQLLNKAIDLQPGNWSSINALGNFLFSSGRYSEAASQYRKVVYLDPDNFVAQGNLASVLMMTGDFSDALTEIENALQFTDNESFQSNRGVAYYYLGQFEKSADVHQQLISRQDSSAYSWMNLADALHFVGDEAGAKQAYETARNESIASLNVDPSSSGALYAMAWSTAMTGEPIVAREFMDRSKQAAPYDPYVHYYDALVYLKAGDVNSSLAAIESAIDLGYPKQLLAAEPHLRDLTSNKDFMALIAN